jgi:hypothetical protein
MASDSIKGSEAYIDLYHSLDIVVVNFPHFSEVSDTGLLFAIGKKEYYSEIHVVVRKLLYKPEAHTDLYHSPRKNVES